MLGTIPRDVPHGTDDGVRWVAVEEERFSEEDIVWPRRSAVLDSVESIAGRNTWREWPETCQRLEGPTPPDQIDEMRIRLTAADVHGPVYLYCAASSAGPAGPVGSTERFEPATGRRATVIQVLLPRGAAGPASGGPAGGLKAGIERRDDEIGRTSNPVTVCNGRTAGRAPAHSPTDRRTLSRAAAEG